MARAFRHPARRSARHRLERAALHGISSSRTGRCPPVPRPRDFGGRAHPDKL